MPIACSPKDSARTAVWKLLESNPLASHPGRMVAAPRNRQTRPRGPGPGGGCDTSDTRHLLGTSRRPPREIPQRSHRHPRPARHRLDRRGAGHHVLRVSDRQFHQRRHPAGAVEPRQGEFNARRGRRRDPAGRKLRHGDDQPRRQRHRRDQAHHLRGQPHQPCGHGGAERLAHG